MFLTCFPITTALRHGVPGAEVGPLFVEEHSVCDGPGVPVPAPELGPGLAGRAAIQWVVDAAAVPGGRIYTIIERAGGWLVAPAGEPHVSDVIVHLGRDGNEARCPMTAEASTVLLAEQCVLEQALWATDVFFPWKIAGGPVPPNDVTVDGLPLLEALCTLYAPQHGAHTGFALLIQDAKRPDRPGMRLGSVRPLPGPAHERP